MSYTPNLLLNNPTPRDPAYTNSWGTMENTGRSLVDTALGGNFSLAVTGGTTVLTSNNGAADQARYAHYTFTGVLTSDQYILWPQSCGRMFSVLNQTTGGYNLILGADDGSSAAAGDTLTVPYNTPVICRSDGTNVYAREPFDQYFSETSPAPGVTSNLPANTYGCNFTVAWPTPFAHAVTGFSAVPGLVSNGNFASVLATSVSLSGATVFLTSGQNAVGVPVLFSVRGW